MNCLKSICRAALFICAIAVCAQAGDYAIEGYWEGAAVREGAVRIIRIEIFKEGDALKAQIEMPDLITYGLRPSAVKVESSTISIRIPTVGEVVMKMNPATGEMMGTAGTGAPSITVNLKRAVKPIEAPIKKEEVQFASGDITLSGTLVTPATTGPHPVIVWILGRGGRIREESARTRLLAQRGVASLIYDKRGSGKSTGDFKKATFDDLVSDALAAARYLAKRPDIDPRQIGLHGESAGGWIAPEVAVRSEIPMAFIMTSAGPAENLYDQQVHAYQHYLKLSGIEFTPEELRLAEEHVRLRLRLAFKNEGREEFNASAEKVKSTRLAKFLLDSEAADASDFDWLRRNDCDPVPALKKIKAPFLAFYGSRDYIVPAEENVRRLESHLREAGNRDFKIVVIPGGDHDLGFAEGNEGDQRWAWGRVSPEYVETMLDWLLKRVTVAKAKQ